MRLATGVKDIEPARIYTGNDELDYDLVLVGYGMNGTGLTGSSESDGLKRGCQNRIDEYIGPESQVMGIMFDAPPSGLPLEGKGGPGDSGSAAFVVIDGKYWLAVIGAGGSDFNEDGIENGYGDLDRFTWVDPVSQWVKKTAGLE